MREVGSTPLRPLGRWWPLSSLCSFVCPRVSLVLDGLAPPLPDSQDWQLGVVGRTRLKLHNANHLSPYRVRLYSSSMGPGWLACLPTRHSLTVHSICASPGRLTKTQTRYHFLAAIDCARA